MHRKFYFPLILSIALILASFSYISAQTSSFDGFDFTFDGVTNNGNGTSTWSYTVTGNGTADHDLSHWVLALCQDHEVLSASPNNWEVNTDPTTGVYGIKWDVGINKNGGIETFEFTLNGEFAVEEVQVAFKASTESFYSTINGPSCGEPVCDGAIGNRVWLDYTGEGSEYNCNGIQDVGEPGIANVTLYLKNSDGVVIAQTTTDDEGYYLFNVTDLCQDIECGDCDGKVTDLTLRYTGSTVDANIMVKQKKDGKIVFNNTVQPGEEFSFEGEDKKGTLGTEIKIYVDGMYNTKIHTSCSEPIGPGLVRGDFYVVSGSSLNGGLLCPINGGTIDDYCYTVEIDESTLPAGYTQTAVMVGSDRDKDSNGNPTEVCLTQVDRVDLTTDFGYCPPPPCENSVGDKVWHDANVNGVQDNNEPGIANVVVELLDGDGNLITTATTDGNGNYLFDDLNAIDYKVRIASSNFDQDGVLYKWYASPKDQGGDDTADSDGDINNRTASVSLDCEYNPTIDFGFFKTCVSLTKTGPASVDAGGVITYEFALENCGDIVLHGGAQVYDEMINPNSDHKIWDGVVQPGEVINFTRTYQTTDDDCGELVNVATVIGHPYMAGRTFANVADESEWTVDVICEEECVTDWTGTLGDSETLCQYEPGEITVTGSVQLTPNPSRAKLQMAWRIVHPNRPDVDNTTHYSSIWINGDTTFTITGWWPGITCEDEIVDVHFGVNVLDCDGNVIHDGIGKDVYWYPWVCDAPACEDVDIQVEKTSSTLYPGDGDQVTFTITATNNGPGDATGIVVTDILPDGLEITNDNPSQGVYDYSTGDWTVGSLANSASATLLITTTVSIDDVNSSTFDFGPAADYNLFVLYDLDQPSSDTQGKVAVGRDANLSNYSVGDQLPSGSGDVLIVGRDLVYESGHVYGGIVYGNNIDLNGTSTSYDGTVTQGNPINFAAAKTYLENLAGQLGGYTTNGTTTYEWSGLTLSGTDPFLNVFSVNGADLTASTWMDITVPNGSVVLVNINGDDITWAGGLEVHGTGIGNVLYNFYEANTLAIHGIDVRGSILAPFANVEFSQGVQNGQMMCKSLTGRGQFNYSLFVGNIPVQTDITNIASLTAVMQNDSDDSNNSSSVTIHVNSEEATGDGSAAGDDGSYWEQVSTFMPGEIVYTLINDNNGNVLAGTWGGKIYRSADGENWERINNSMYTGFIWTLAVNEFGDIFAGTEQGIYRSTDNGVTFELVGMVGKDVRTIVIDGYDIYAGAWGEGVFKSSDNGANWTAVNNGLTNLAVNSMVMDSESNLYVASFGSGVFKSNNGGTNWSQLDVGYDFVWTLGIASTDIIYAGTYGDGLYRSGDHGISWGKVETGLTAYYIYAITIDADDHVYVSSWANGVFVSSDDIGASWSSIGLGGVGVSSVMINPASKDLYAGTSDGAVYKKISANITDVDDNAQVVPTEFELSQNYPNPFNPSTNIRFSIPESGKYMLKIYNILGQEVTTLLNEVMSPGTYTFEFNARSIASGIYFYRLTGDNNVNITKKMVLMK